MDYLKVRLHQLQMALAAHGSAAASTWACTAIAVSDRGVGIMLPAAAVHG
jgi:hypothetical protein